VTRDCAGAGTEVAALHREIVDRQAEIIRLRAQVEQLKSPAATEQSQRDYDHGYGVGYEHGIKEASAECKKLLGLVESATAWLDQEITRAADQQRQSYAMSGEHGQRQGERWHARQIALYEAKLKLTSTVLENATEDGK
jgi:multidrug resistance efflux pump